MDDIDRIARLTPYQRECLELYARNYSIAEIATALNISISAVNQRLRGARLVLGVGSSQTAARMVTEHDQRRAIWIPPTGSENTVLERPFSASGDAVTTLEGRSDDHLEDSGHGGIAAENTTSAGFVVRMPFPTAGRPENDLTATSRMGWALTLAILALALLMIVALLSLGVQDVLSGVQNSIAQLH